MKVIVFWLIALFFSHAVTADDFARKLAQVDEDRPIAENSIETKRAANAIKIAMSVCNEKSKDELLEEVWRTVQILRKKDEYSRPVDILEGLKAILDGAIEKQDCASTMSYYISARTGAGQSHSEAVAGMRILMKTLGIITYPKK